MKREFWAEFDVFHETQKRALIHYFVGKENTHTSWKTIEDYAARQSILAQLLASDEECARRTKCKDYAKGKNGLQWWYYGEIISKKPQGSFQQFLKERLEWMASLLNLVKPPKSTAESPVSPRLPNLAAFPPGSWALQLTFTLRKPYISKDDTDFYILDNPVKKEWVFKVPYVAPSQWKGALRAAMTRDLAAWWQSLPGHARQKREVRKQFVQRRLQIVRLFGNEKGVLVDDSQFEAYLDHAVEDERLNRWYRRALRCLYAPTGFLAGRLHFYPTFFDKIGLEVINPHDRETGAGKNPIYFEAVPAGTKGVFTLLYVPLGAGPTDEATRVRDLAAVARGVQAMLTVYGFGAKTSSGYGVAKEDVEGKLMAHFPNASLEAQPSQAMSTSVEAPEEVFLKYLDESGEVKAAFKGSGEGGLMSNREYKEKGKALGGGTLSEFKAFRAWYSEHGEAWRASQSHQEERSSDKSVVFQRAFGTLDKLAEIASWLQGQVAVSSEE